ncbi:MAG TPA: hypothetical protein VHI72_00055 [Hyphomicrobiaceae bacterium]|jgi:hypothetical protein|nr:hypothetical protein [Hyphomicrobiaceae bacterium]
MDQRLIAVAVAVHWCPLTVLSPAIGACWHHDSDFLPQEMQGARFTVRDGKAKKLGRRDRARRATNHARRLFIQRALAAFRGDRGRASARRFVYVGRPVKPAFLASEPAAQIDDFEAFAQAVGEATGE